MNHARISMAFVLSLVSMPARNINTSQPAAQPAIALQTWQGLIAFTQ